MSKSGEEVTSELTKHLSDGKFLEIRDEYKGYNMLFAEIPTHKLEVVVYQRRPSKAHVKNLVKSISTIGFVVPLVVAKKPNEDKFIILDGQHRYLACLDLGIRKIPCIVIPWEYATLMINLNIEKQPNIKEKSYVALRIYNELVNMFPDKGEAEEEVIQSVEEIYFVTVGMVYDKEDRFSGSSWEPILKKADWPFDLPLKEAKLKREKRAQLLEELHHIVREIAAKLKDIGISHPFVYKEIVSYVNPMKRQKAIVEFEEVFSQVREKLIELRENPEELKGAIEMEESLE